MSWIAADNDAAKERPTRIPMKYGKFHHRLLDRALCGIALWVLVSMVGDALTPKWLTVYMIGASLAPIALGWIFWPLLAL
jgi:hypothetical protein